jgi:hypothetical protein
VGVNKQKTHLDSKLYPLNTTPTPTKYSVWQENDVLRVKISHQACDYQSKMQFYRNVKVGSFKKKLQVRVV